MKDNFAPFTDNQYHRVRQKVLLDTFCVVLYSKRINDPKYGAMERKHAQ